ncbi:hypothetical protein KIPB_008812 [Kipferlia bialata]|uniref:Uncharacterized protein n=1 Tax=Kipferlia bialata TaxID=797122 RepID=A0A9K3D184_9EUKA|nr:hypothetical protein KIPB_008812 [Kipferlia bialata]|eukprot:g8812.t1
MPKFTRITDSCFAQRDCPEGERTQHGSENSHPKHNGRGGLTEGAKKPRRGTRVIQRHRTYPPTRTAIQPSSRSGHPSRPSAPSSLQIRDKSKELMDDAGITLDNVCGEGLQLLKENILWPLLGMSEAAFEALLDSAIPTDPIPGWYGVVNGMRRVWDREGNRPSDFKEWPAAKTAIDDLTKKVLGHFGESAEFSWLEKEVGEGDVDLRFEGLGQAMRLSVSRDHQKLCNLTLLLMRCRYLRQADLNRDGEGRTNIALKAYTHMQCLVSLAVVYAWDRSRFVG